MNTNNLDIPILDQLPAKWQGPALLVAMLLPYVTRAYHALANGGGLKGLWSAIWFGTNSPRPTPKGQAPGKVLPILLCLGLAAALPACGTLDSSGPYKGDKVLYDADYAIATSYGTIHEFLLWEYQNRPGLSTTAPEVKKIADTLRAQSPAAFRSAIALRDAYAAAPNAGTQDALNRAIAVLHGMVSQATTCLVGSQATPVSPPTPPTPTAR